MASRSLLDGLLGTTIRSINNPVGGNSIRSIAASTADYNTVTSKSNMQIIDFIEQNYGQQSASKNYHSISTNIFIYDALFNNIQNIINNITTPELITIVTAIKELLTASFNSVSLHRDNIVQNITISTLNKQIQDMLNNKNRELLLKQNTSGNISITQSFSLAPVYNYYIAIYGMPLQGQGFNPLKVSYIADVLTDMNIDPYN
tara:strand:+ start:599 stop:1207 length:609 start_codon:yes stop_codon:yes gene_type:complete